MYVSCYLSSMRALRAVSRMLASTRPPHPATLFG